MLLQLFLLLVFLVLLSLVWPPAQRRVATVRRTVAPPVKSSSIDQP